MTRTAESRHRDKEQTRSDLLAAGAQLFATCGFEGTSLDAIAGEIGVNKALISYYFKSKAGLYQAIIFENVQLVKAQLEASNIEALPAEEAMRTYIRALGEAMGARPHFGSMIVREHVSSAFIGNQASAAELLGFFMMTSAILARGVTEGVFLKIDHHLFHLNLIGSLVFFIATDRFRQNAEITGVLDNQRPDLDEFIVHTQDLFLGGLLISG